MARAMVTQYGMSPELGAQVFGQPNHEVFLGRDYGNTQDYSEETARRIDDEVARIMKEAHDRAYEVLSNHRDQMDLMASVLLERETVEGEACQALLDNKWNEYLDHEDEIITRHEREEAEARARDAQLADPNWNAQQGQQSMLPAQAQPVSPQPVQQPQQQPALRGSILSSGSGLLHDLESRFSTLSDEQAKSAQQDGSAAQQGGNDAAQQGTAQQPDAGAAQQGSGATAASDDAASSEPSDAAPNEAAPGEAQSHGKDGFDAR